MTFDGISTHPRVTGAAEVLLTAEQLTERVDELGASIRELVGGSEQPPILISVLKGSTFFLADLMRAAAIDLIVDFMAISSYGGSGSGVVKIVKDLEVDIVDRDVLIVEDIVDTGLTLNYLRRALSERSPRSLATVTLLDKSVRRIVPVPVELVGFEVPDVFVLGYGLDFQGRYRNVPDILAVRDIARLANDPNLLFEELFTPA
jgi:hypoxanthine phosphoribosyltransferase